VGWQGAVDCWRKGGPRGVQGKQLGRMCTPLLRQQRHPRFAAAAAGAGPVYHHPHYHAANQTTHLEQLLLGWYTTHAPPYPTRDPNNQQQPSPPPPLSQSAKAPAYAYLEQLLLCGAILLAGLGLDLVGAPHVLVKHLHNEGGQAGGGLAQMDAGKQ
jgi:hypothetical protein